MTTSVITQASALYGTEKREKCLVFAKEGLDTSFPDADWVLLDFHTVEVNGWDKFDSVDVFDPESPQISFRVRPSGSGSWDPREVSVMLWSDGAPISEWVVLRDRREFAKEIAEIPEFKQVYRESIHFGCAA